MHTCWLTGIAVNKVNCYFIPTGCSASCVLSTRCSAYCLYKMYGILYLSDSAQAVSTPVDMWREDRTHHITQRDVGRQQQQQAIQNESEDHPSDEHKINPVHSNIKHPDSDMVLPTFLACPSYSHQVNVAKVSSPLVHVLEMWHNVMVSIRFHYSVN